MIVSIIVAMDEKRGIGLRGGIPWRVWGEQLRFKRITMGHHLIMGRKTYESIGKPLEGRVMVVLSRDAGYQVEGCQVAGSLEEGLGMAREAGEDEVFIIGGAGVYAEALPLAERMYLTVVHAEVEADRFFPAFEEGEWVEREAVFFPAGGRNVFGYTARVLERETGRQGNT